MRNASEKGVRLQQGQKGPVVPTPPGKTRITIRPDDEVIEWFKRKVSRMHQALRDLIENEREPLEDTLRRVVREELRNAS